MENASKALLMAGGVLIAMLILSLAVYLYASFGADSRRIHAEIAEREVTQFNAQFTIYTGRNDITIHDIISVANLAKENNDHYDTYAEHENAYQVIVAFNAGGDSDGMLQNLEINRKQVLLQKYGEMTPEGELKYRFNCNKVEYHSNGRVKYIKFDKIN